MNLIFLSVIVKNRVTILCEIDFLELIIQYVLCVEIPATPFEGHSDLILGAVCSFLEPIVD